MDTQPKMPSEKLNAKKSMAETISQLAHRHLKDPNHTTTDEELRYAKVELTGSIEPADESFFDNTPIFPRAATEPRHTDEARKEKRSTATNPYNIYS
ncbi:MAG TPA: hypothetical protein VF540_12620 [Segetibacter sp.]